MVTEAAATVAPVGSETVPSMPVSRDWDLASATTASNVTRTRYRISTSLSRYALGVPTFGDQRGTANNLVEPALRGLSDYRMRLRRLSTTFGFLGARVFRLTPCTF